MKVAILGSGFGLYGYLPAVSHGCGERVVLPERYRARLQSRDDARHLAEKVEWAADERAALDAADALIVSQRPQDQVRWVGECLRRPHLKRILLEKPLAPTPGEATRVLESLRKQGRVVRIGYTFRYTRWGGDLLAAPGRAEARPPIRIEWRFRAHHYALDLNNWKRSVSQGGGVVRFYGIHVIALLAEMGYRSVLASVVGADRPDEAERWGAVFGGRGLPECHVEIDANAATEHLAVRSGSASIQLRDPFEAAANGQRFDRRVGILTELCRDLLADGTASCPWYAASIDLWADVERVTRLVPKSNVGT